MNEQSLFTDRFILKTIGELRHHGSSLSGIENVPFVVDAKDNHKRIPVEAEFRFWRGGWHLYDFSYRDQGTVRTIHVTRNPD